MKSSAHGYLYTNMNLLYNPVHFTSIHLDNISISPKRHPPAEISCPSSNWSFPWIFWGTLPLLNHHHVGENSQPPGGWIVWRRPRHIIADATVAPLALIIPSWPKTETELRVDPHTHTMVYSPTFSVNVGEYTIHGWYGIRYSSQNSYCTSAAMS